MCIRDRKRVYVKKISHHPIQIPTADMYPAGSLNTVAVDNKNAG